MNMEIDQPSSPASSSSKSKPVNPKKGPKASRPKGMKKSNKFKDFTLDKKTLFHTFSDEEKRKILNPPAAPKKGSQQPGEPMEKSSSFVTAAIAESQKCVSGNGAISFSSSGDPRADFFFQVMEQSDPTEVRELLEKSWKLHPLHSLKMVAALRDIKEGKGIRRQYHDCLLWMYKNHPKTLYENLDQLLTFGYWKDILQFLMVIQFDGYIHSHLNQDDRGGVGSSDRQRRSYNHNKRRKGASSQAQDDDKEKKKASTISNLSEKEAYNKLIHRHYGYEGRTVTNRFQSVLMKEMRVRFAREKFRGDSKYRLFHVKVAQIFARQLYTDLVEFKKDSLGSQTKKVSLAAKWAPSIEGHFDRYTLISTTVALELVKLLQENPIQNGEMAEILEPGLMTKPLPVVVYLARRCYHKNFCVPLRKFFELPETVMSAGQWGQVNYDRVASKCMQRNSQLFVEHDGKRFERHLKKEEGKVAGATLKPIEILNRAMNVSLTDNTVEERVEKRLIEKQWTSLLTDIKGKGGGLLKNAVAVCKVGRDDPADNSAAAMGLALVTMSLSDKPWNSTCISFQKNPKFHEIPPESSLVDKVAALQLMDGGAYTDLHAVFKLIVSVGVKYGLSQAEMPRALLIFTHMEFDQAFRDSIDNRGEGSGGRSGGMGRNKNAETTEFMSMTNFEAAKKLFVDKGYAVPALIFWNLKKPMGGQRTKSTPVRVNDFGAILLSGFSAQQLAYVIRQEDLSKVNPLQFVLDVVDKVKYQNLKIFD